MFRGGHLAHGVGGAPLDFGNNNVGVAWLVASYYDGRMWQVWNLLGALCTQGAMHASIATQPAAHIPLFTSCLPGHSAEHSVVLVGTAINR